MAPFVLLLKLAALMAAAIFLGNWFLSEVRAAKRNRLPWHAPYLSIPGILIIVILMLPLLIRVLK